MGWYIEVQGAVDKIELYSKDKENCQKVAKIATTWPGDKKSLFMLEHPVFK